MIDCPKCGHSARTNSSGEVQCENCGYDEANDEEPKVCQSCGYPIDKDGFCTAPLSVAD